MEPANQGPANVHKIVHNFVPEIVQNFIQEIVCNFFRELFTTLLADIIDLT